MLQHQGRFYSRQTKVTSLLFKWSRREEKKPSPVSSGSVSSESNCNNKLCGIGLPPAFTANCLHSNEKRPRLSGILDDLPRAKQRRDNGRRWLKVGPRRRPQMGFFFSPTSPSFRILHFPSAATRALNSVGQGRLRQISARNSQM